MFSFLTLETVLGAFGFVASMTHFTTQKKQLEGAIMRHSTYRGPSFANYFPDSHSGAFNLLVPILKINLCFKGDVRDGTVLHMKLWLNGIFPQHSLLYLCDMLNPLPTPVPCVFLCLKVLVRFLLLLETPWKKQTGVKSIYFFWHFTVHDGWKSRQELETETDRGTPFVDLFSGPGSVSPVPAAWW